MKIPSNQPKKINKLKKISVKQKNKFKFVFIYYYYYKHLLKEFEITC